MARGTSPHGSTTPSVLYATHLLLYATLTPHHSRVKRVIIPLLEVTTSLVSGAFPGRERDGGCGTGAGRQVTAYRASRKVSRRGARRSEEPSVIDLFELFVSY